MIRVFQLEPTVVVQSGTHILKVFATSDRCKEEVKILERDDSPVLSQLQTGEKMRIVDIAWQKGSVLAMEMASGFVLAVPSREQESTIALAARLLATRHLDLIAVDKRKHGRLLGDFVIDHLFWDDAAKTMTLIDPGTNYFVEGDLTEDCARFMFSICSTFRWNPIRAVKLISLFAQTYLSLVGEEKGSLTGAVKFRLVRSVEKYKNQKSFMRATLGALLLCSHFYLIRFALKRFDA